MIPGSKVVKIVPWSCANMFWKGRPIEKDEVHEVREMVPDKVAFGLTMSLVGIYNPIIGSGPNAGREFGYDPHEFREIDPLFDLLPDEKVANPEEHIILQPLVLENAAD